MHSFQRFKSKIFMRIILRELVKIKNRTVWSWYGFYHVAKTEGSFWQWIIVNIISGSLTFFLPITFTQQAIILAGGISGYGDDIREIYVVYSMKYAGIYLSYDSELEPLQIT